MDDRLFVSNTPTLNNLYIVITARYDLRGYYIHMRKLKKNDIIVVERRMKLYTIIPVAQDCRIYSTI